MQGQEIPVKSVLVTKIGTHLTKGSQALVPNTPNICFPRLTKMLPELLGI